MLFQDAHRATGEQLYLVLPQKHLRSSGAAVWLTSMQTAPRVASVLSAIKRLGGLIISEAC